MLYRLSRSDSGLTLVEVLVALGVAGLLALLATPVVMNLVLGARNFEKKNDLMELRLALSNFVNDPIACPCQVDQRQNLTRATFLSVNTTAPRPADIDLGIIRESCDFAAANNTIAKAGAALPKSTSGIVVDRVLIRNIKPAELVNRYSAEISISFLTDSIPLAPVTVPFLFDVDTTAGTPSARPMKDCGKPATKRIVTCPAGMVLIGAPGAIGTFCVESAARPVPASFTQAHNLCAGKQQQ